MNSHFIARVDTRSDKDGDVIAQYEVGGTIPIADGHQTDNGPHQATEEKIYSYSLAQAKSQFYGMTNFYFDIISYREVTLEEYAEFNGGNVWSSDEGL